MASKASEKIKLLSTAGTGYFYTTSKNKKTMTSEITKDVIKVIVGLVIVMLLVDFFGYAAWTIYGQKPADGFYAGVITAHLIGPIR